MCGILLSTFRQPADKSAQTEIVASKPFYSNIHVLACMREGWLPARFIGVTNDLLIQFHGRRAATRPPHAPAAARGRT